VTQDDFLESISDELDRRREAVTRVKRVVAQVRGTTLEQTAAVMAIPVLYAHWEGFVKQAVGTYVEFVETQAMLPHQANAGIFAFSIKKRIRGLIHNQSAAKMAEFAGWLIKIARDPMIFDDKSVDTRGNLSFSNLAALCESLSIDVRSLEIDKKKIDSLVHKRNNIAHTGRDPKYNENDVDENAGLLINILEQFEQIMKQCVTSCHFKASEAASITRSC
jgi:hypothetical protein